MKTLQTFSLVHAQVHNHFDQERHLVTRPGLQTRRSAALAESERPRGLIAAWGLRVLRPTQTTCRCSDKAHALLRQLLERAGATTGVKRLGGGVTLLIVLTRITTWSNSLCRAVMTHFLVFRLLVRPK